MLASLSEKRALVPILWFYEVGNGLLMADRRKRIALDQIEGFLTRLKALPIDAAQHTPSDILALPTLAQAHGLTNYDAAYLSMAMGTNLPLATTHKPRRRAALRPQPETQQFKTTKCRSEKRDISNEVRKGTFLKRFDRPWRLELDNTGGRAYVLYADRVEIGNSGLDVGTRSGSNPNLRKGGDNHES